MIQLTCTQCKSVLEMDDAFAGGVCRCQHCGTIQTVPSHLKGSAAEPAAASKSVYQSASAGARQGGTGLFDLADAVASSGLSGGRLHEKPATPDYSHPKKGKSAAPPNRTPLLIIAGGIIVVLIGVVFWLATGKTTPTPVPTPNQSTPAGAATPTPPPEVESTPKVTVAAPAPAGPHFLSLPIDASKVVYVIDRSDSARQTLDTIKAATYNSIGSLGASRAFAVIFWGKAGETDLKQLSFPETGLAQASPQQLEIARNKFDDIQAFGTSDVSAAIRQAVELKPDAIFLVTAKGVNLDDDFARAVASSSGSSGARIFTVDLANGEGKAILEPIAGKSHGTYISFSPLEVKPD